MLFVGQILVQRQNLATSASWSRRNCSRSLAAGQHDLHRFLGVTVPIAATA